MIGFTFVRSACDVSFMNNPWLRTTPPYQIENILSECFAQLNIVVLIHRIGIWLYCVFSALLHSTAHHAISSDAMVLVNTSLCVSSHCMVVCVTVSVYRFTSRIDYVSLSHCLTETKCCCYCSDIFTCAVSFHRWKPMKQYVMHAGWSIVV